LEAFKQKTSKRVETYTSDLKTRIGKLKELRQTVSYPIEAIRKNVEKITQSVTKQDDSIFSLETQQ
jgi:hypothetical protein